MDFDREWTEFTVDVEFNSFGVTRIVKAHNKLKEQLTALRKLVLDAKETVGLLQNKIIEQQGAITHLRSGEWLPENPEITGGSSTKSYSDHYLAVDRYIKAVLQILPCADKNNPNHTDAYQATAKQRATGQAGGKNDKLKG